MAKCQASQVGPVFHQIPALDHLQTWLTITFLQRFAWWPSLAEDDCECIATCPICAQNNNVHQPSSGLLQPLPTPSRPWSHIAIHFITIQPPSSGNSVILTIIDRFSKAAHFVALPKLPSALETTQLLTDHVLHLHGIPTDIVSDKGPQFTLRVWKEFCNVVRAQVSLSSSFHPQTNGQTEWANQELEAALQCLTSTNQTNNSHGSSTLTTASPPLPPECPPSRRP